MVEKKREKRKRQKEKEEKEKRRNKENKGEIRYDNKYERTKIVFKTKVRARIMILKKEGKNTNKYQ